MDQFNYALGSTSEIKYHAVIEALELNGIRGYKLIGGDCNPQIRAQPFGFEETFKGALYRATNALRIFKEEERNKTIGIGIENGIIEINEFYFDIAIIAIIVPGYPVFYATTQGISILFKFVEQSLLCGGEKTVGSFIAAELGGDPNDPHATLTGGIVKRQDILVDALKLILAQIKTMVYSR